MAAQKCTSSSSLLSKKSSHNKSSANIASQIDLITSKCLLGLTTNDFLLNPFSYKRDTPEQQHDLLHFRQMGSVEFVKYIEYYILQQASVYVQNRKKHLLTFSDKRIRRSRVSQLESQLDNLINL